MRDSSNKTAHIIATAGITILVGALACIALMAREKPLASAAPAATNAQPPAVRTQWPVQIRRPAGAPKVLTALTNYQGRAVEVSCSSCHATTRPNPNLRDAKELKQFHQGLTFQHGNLSCLSCHNAENYDSLRLADGTRLEFENVMQLCGQCHGPQARDYKNGSHGGMTGHWDLGKGPRTRNNCIHCHNPHAPQYPVVMPVFEPVQAERGKKSETRKH